MGSWLISYWFSHIYFNTNQESLLWISIHPIWMIYYYYFTIKVYDFLKSNLIEYIWFSLISLPNKGYMIIMSSFCVSENPLTLFNFKAILVQEISQITDCYIWSQSNETPHAVNSAPEINFSSWLLFMNPLIE